MDSKIITLSKYRLGRAKEDLESAKVNLENGLLKASINRSYYCIFHTIRAINALNEFDSKRHSGVIAHFNQYFIHTGDFDRETYSIISLAYKIREKSDYDDFYIASKQDAEDQLENASYLVKLAEEYLMEKYPYKWRRAKMIVISNTIPIPIRFGISWIQKRFCFHDIPSISTIPPANCLGKYKFTYGIQGSR